MSVPLLDAEKMVQATVLASKCELLDALLCVVAQALARGWVGPDVAYRLTSTAIIGAKLTRAELLALRDRQDKLVAVCFKKGAEELAKREHRP